LSSDNLLKKGERVLDRAERYLKFCGTLSQFLTSPITEKQKSRCANFLPLRACNDRCRRSGTSPQLDRCAHSLNLQSFLRCDMLERSPSTYINFENEGICIMFLPKDGPMPCQ